MEIKPTSNNFQSFRGPEIEKSGGSLPAKITSETSVDSNKKAEALEPIMIPDDQLNSAIDKANTFMSEKASGLEFSVDEDTGRSIVKLIDKQTNEILRQYPSKEMIEISKDLSKFQGMLISAKI